MKKRPGYIFTNKVHSQRSIMSTILGVISCLSLLAVIYLTFIQQGDAPLSYGLTGFLALIMSLVGLVLGIITAMEKDHYKLFPGIGIVLNLLAILGVGVVIYAGVYI